MTAPDRPRTPSLALELTMTARTNPLVTRRRLRSGAALLVAVFGLSTAALAGPSSSSSPPASSGSSSAVGKASVPLLKSLDPQQYMQRRNQVPDTSAELSTLPVEVSFAILAGAPIPHAEALAYPAGFKPEKVAALQARETAAAVMGALVVVVRAGQNGDVRAHNAIVATIARADANHDDIVASVAAERLGELKTDAAVNALAILAADTSRSLDLRAGALAGLARVRTEKALKVVLAVAVDDASKGPVRQSALKAVEHLTSRWAFQAKGDVAEGDRLRAMAATQLAALNDDAATKTVARLR